MQQNMKPFRQVIALTLFFATLNIVCAAQIGSKKKTDSSTTKVSITRTVTDYFLEIPSESVADVSKTERETLLKQSGKVNLKGRFLEIKTTDATPRRIFAALFYKKDANGEIQDVILATDISAESPTHVKNISFSAYDKGNYTDLTMDLFDEGFFEQYPTPEKCSLKFHQVDDKKLNISFSGAALICELPDKTEQLYIWSETTSKFYAAN